MYNSIDWNNINIQGGTVELSHIEFKLYRVYKMIVLALSRYRSLAYEFVDKHVDNIRKLYFKKIYGVRINLLGQEVADMEYFLNRNGEIKVRKFTGNDGIYKLIDNKSVKIDSEGRGSMWGEANVAKMAQVAYEIIDKETDEKAAAKGIKAENWEMALSKRNYGFNKQWSTGLDHERG
jgi:hypothetical protein